MSLESDKPPAAPVPQPPTVPLPPRPSSTIPRLPVHRPNTGAGLRPPVIQAPLIPVAEAGAETPLLRKETARVPLPVRTFAAPPVPSIAAPLPQQPQPAEHPFSGTESEGGSDGNSGSAGSNFPSAAQPSAKGPGTTLVMQPKRIIVIDDDESLTFTFKLALESRGHIVETENRGVRAIDAIERFAPDVIFLDIIMPGSDGGEVYTRLRSLPRLASIPVVFLTAMVTRAEARQGVPNERGLRYLSKPASIDDVEKAIALIFGL